MAKTLLTLLFTSVLAFPLSTLGFAQGRLPLRRRPRRRRAGRGFHEKQ